MRGKLCLIATVLAAACETIAPPEVGPPKAVRLEPVTSTVLTGTVGTEVASPPTVRVTSKDGSPVAGTTVYFKASAGTVGKTVVETDVNGQATAGWWRLGPTTGNQTVTAAAAGPVAVVVFTATAETGPAARITQGGGDDQAGPARSKLLQPLRVRVTDSFYNPVVGAVVTFTVIAGEGAIENGVAVADLDGIAEPGPWTLGPAGLQQVRAESGTAQAVFSAQAYNPPTGLQGQLAFASDRDGSSEIYVVNADGSGLRRLTSSNGSTYGSPRWSPDGGQIAFVGSRDGESSIHVMSADGSNVTLRTTGQAPAWSPDGSAIAFATLHNGSLQIATMRNSDGTIGFVTDGMGYKTQPSWSPDGRQLAFVRDSDLYTINFDGTGLTPRTRNDFQWWGSPVLHPAWSPDGKMIAYVYGTDLGEDLRFKVMVMSADGAFTKALAWAGDASLYALSFPGSLTWSPDGRGIAYTFVDCGIAGGRPVCSHSVKYVSLDGFEQGTILDNADSPSWRR